MQEHTDAVPNARAADSLLRLAAGAALLLAVALLLWQQGVLFSSGLEDVTLTDASGETRLVAVRPATVDLKTPDATGPRGGALSVAPRPGYLAPDFEVSDFAGNRVRLSDFRGRPILLNFWATWCPPCAAEMPDMEALLEQFDEAGLVVLALNSGEKFELAYYFVQLLGVDLTVFGLDPTEAVTGLYQVRGLPTSFVIDSRGVVVRVHLGQLSLAQMEAFVLEALASGSDAPTASRSTGR